MSEQEQLEQAIQALEAQRAVLGDAVVEAALGPMRRQLAELEEKEYAPTLKGERKLVTVMFADISGFTALAERMDPEAVRDLTNSCFERLVPIVEKYGGTVDKFIGDEIMALFGAPVNHENDSERALRAALEMEEAIRVWRERLPNSASHIALHIGINTGIVIAGGIGTQKLQDYTVMGDAVNVASRLEGVSERGEILVGPDTYRLTAPLFEFETLTPVQVRGKAEPVPVYRLLAAKTVRGKVRGIAGLESPLVGRDAELCALQEAVERLRAGEGGLGKRSGLVVLIGEAGLGKSRLVAELRASATNLPTSQSTNLPVYQSPNLPVYQSPNPPIQWVEGRCLSYGSPTAYLLWSHVLRGLLGVTAEDAPTMVQDALRERVRALCPSRFEDVFPYLSWLMSLPLTAEAEAAIGELEGGKLKSAIFRAVETLIESITRKRPLVIVCEDLHWADPTSIELLEYLLDLVDRAPLLLICVFRPEREHVSWRIREVATRRQRRAKVLWLQPLSTAEGRTLVGSLLHVDELPPKLKDRILSRAEGNPFYIEEIIRSLMDSGDIARDEAIAPSTSSGQAPSTGLIASRWHATRDVEEIVIPDTLRGVLMARIDRLPQEAKRVLQLASVLGRIFLHRVLVAVAQDEHPVDEHLLTLQREEMIRERKQSPDLEYIFKHQLTQEAAYDSLLKKERRAYHRRAAEALKQLFPDRPREYAGLLGYHWEQAGEIGHAIPHLLHAGRLALRNFASTEAEDYLSRALDFARQTGLALAEAEALHELSYASRYQGDYAGAKAHIEQALSIYRVMSNRAREGMLLSDFGAISLRQGDYEGARAHFERVLHIYRMINSRRGEASALNKLGGVCRDQGDYAEARAHFEQALRLSRGMRNHWSEAIALGNLGNVCRDQGDYASAAAYLEPALGLSRKLKSRRMESIALSNLSLLCHLRGDDEAAHEHARQTLQILQDIGDRFAQGRALVVLGHALAGLGRLAEAFEAYHQALTLQRELNEHREAVESLAGLTSVFLEQGDLSRAKTRVEEILRYLETGTLEGTMEPFRVYLTCYRTLRAAGDRRAPVILSEAHDLLQERAARITDEKLRRSFLESVVVHREIVEEFAKTT